MATISITNEHYRRNATTRHLWEWVAPHRARVMELLCEAHVKRGGSLCLLGTGNGNDVNLARLAEDFERIALVDLDCAALARAVGRLDADRKRRIDCYSPIDLSGILPVLESWRSVRKPTDEEITEVVKAARAVRRPDVGSFDVVASTCMLTQLIDSVYMALSKEHRRCVELVLEVVNRHLEIMLELLNEGGSGVLVTDFVASEDADGLAPLNELRLPRAVKWVHERDIFTGANPFAIRDYLNRSRPPGRFAVDAQVCGPWRWEIGPKPLGVAAVTFRRGA
jgi:hypothetical protein